MNDITDVVGIALFAVRADRVILMAVARTIWNKIRPKSVNLIHIEPDEEDGGYIASWLTSPRCDSQGETVEEAMTHIVDAIAAYIRGFSDRASRQKFVADARAFECSDPKYVGVRSVQ